jgi:hypothetical protein
MAGGMKMLGRILVLRIIATADMAACPANPQMNPGVFGFRTLFAAQQAGRDIADFRIGCNEWP